MGYKLAGFDVIGCNEIDPRMMEVYQHNDAPTRTHGAICRQPSLPRLITTKGTI